MERYGGQLERTVGDGEGICRRKTVAGGVGS